MQDGRPVCRCRRRRCRRRPLWIHGCVRQPFTKMRGKEKSTRNLLHRHFAPLSYETDSLLARTGFAGVEVQPTLPTTPGSASGGGITTSPIGGAVTAEAHIDPHYLIRTSTHISAAQSANKIKFALEQSVGCLLALENSGALRTGATTPPVDLVAVAAFDPAAAIEAVARAYAQADSTSGAEREDEAEGEAGRHVSSAETSGGTVGRERWVVQGEKPTVVLGSRGHGLVERVLVGSTTSELLHSAYACHLVVVK
ncbi:hypothetical protein DFJ73DRAFT_860530 [Zopfochytrium polystomum]|nr:hypothetical protein DFJ73DRAFT_860530 [Zopfochytrium polystomum]